MATRGGGVYFPVDAGFCDTTVARQIGRRLGAVGQWAYVRTLCCLLNEPGGRLPLASEDEWADLADRLRLPSEDCRELVALMEHYGALEREGGYVFSVAVSDSIAAREAKREAAMKGNASRWGKRKGPSQSESQCD
jgi:hypothetical protein